jgi:FHS family L-fucose permease-like MFS transporter
MSEITQNSVAKDEIVQLPDGYLSKTPWFQYILISCMFPLWGCAASLNDILIAQFKSVFTLSDFATALVQSAFYGGYFLISIPAAQIIARTTYKTGILIGLGFYIIGCTLFFPASGMATYTMFLFAVFGIAIGLGFLETSCNTYSTMLGPKDKATLRLNISQTFYPIGAITGVLLGKYLIFQEGESLSNQMAAMTAEALHAFKLECLQYTLEPYKVIIGILAVVFVIALLTKMPSCKVQNNANVAKPGFVETIKYLLSNRRFMVGIFTEFLYVGMQVAVWSFTIRLALSLDSSINERNASDFMVFSFICFFVGKFAANVLFTKFSVNKVMVVFSLLGVALILYTALAPNFSAIYAAVAVSIMMGPGWATIYAETLKEADPKYKETAGAICVMAIVGAAVVPAIQGLVSDMLGSLQLSFLVNAVCFSVIALFFLAKLKREN